MHAIFFSSTAEHQCSINPTDKKLEDFLAGCEFYNGPFKQGTLYKVEHGWPKHKELHDSPLQSVYLGVLGYSKVKQLTCYSSPQFQASITKII